MGGRKDTDKRKDAYRDLRSQFRRQGIYEVSEGHTAFVRGVRESDT